MSINGREVPTDRCPICGAEYDAWVVNGDKADTPIGESVIFSCDAVIEGRPFIADRFEVTKVCTTVKVRAVH